MTPTYGDAFKFTRVPNIYFYTSNTEKLLQARLVFMRHGYQLRHHRGVREPYEEDYTLGARTLLEKAIKQVNTEFNVRSLFFVEDTSLRVEALSGEEDYPGLAVKEWFAGTNFKELDRTLKARGTGREVTVKSEIALYVPNLSRPLFFHGETQGVIAKTPPKFEASIQYPWLTPLTFNGWFIPKGASKRLGEMEFEESLKYDFRVQSLTSLLSRIEEITAGLNLPSQFYGVRQPVWSSNPSQLPLLSDAAATTIVVVGPKCSGKSTLADYVASTKDCLCIEASAIFRSIADEGKIDVSSSSKAISFLKNHGMHLVAEKISQILLRDEAPLKIVTGLRTIEELSYLKRYNGAVRILFVDADVTTRYERHIRRARQMELMNINAFKAYDEKQCEFGLLRVAEILADIVMRNEGAMAQYHQKIDVAIKHFRDGGRATQSPSTQNELYRSLKALATIGRAATCEEISQATRLNGRAIRVYNTNRALKGAPELARRMERSKSLLKYKILPAGEVFITLAEGV